MKRSSSMRWYELFVFLRSHFIPESLTEVKNEIKNEFK